MNKKALLLFGIALVAAFLIFSLIRSDQPRLQQLSGQTMGTIIYNVKYLGTGDEVNVVQTDSLLKAFNQSLSTYIPDSEISELNRTGQLSFRSPFFYPVLKTSEDIYQRTDGTFDPTVGPLIGAWGFGPEQQLPSLDSAIVDSLLNVVGYDKVQFDASGVSIAKNHRLDFSAIAKGYAVDLVSELLEQKGIENYLVEIGGEVRCMGVNAEGKSWALGIEDPTVKTQDQIPLAIVRLKDRSLATSGNYRNYYEKEGRIYAHIIDPRTGYTSVHNLLSASVFAEDCMTADAFATAFMVLGLEESKKIIAQENVDAFLIYQDEEGVLRSFVSDGITPFVELNKTN